MIPDLVLSTDPFAVHGLHKISLTVLSDFRFRKRSLPFLTVDATIVYQAYSHDRCNIFPD